MASFSVPCPKCPVPSSLLGLKSNKILFQSGLSLKNSQSFGSLSAESASFGIQCLNKKQFPVKIQAQLNEAAVVENLNSAPTVASSEEKENQNGSVPASTVSDESAISAFMSQVADLVILVDSRDIVELQLKQSDYELVIRKKRSFAASTSHGYAAISTTIVLSDTSFAATPATDSLFCYCELSTFESNTCLTSPQNKCIISPTAEMSDGRNLLQVPWTWRTSICPGGRYSAKRPSYLHY